MDIYSAGVRSNERKASIATVQLSLVSPEKLLFAGEVDQVDLPGVEGDFGVLAGHAPIVAMLRPGIVIAIEIVGAPRLSPKRTRQFPRGFLAGVSSDCQIPPQRHQGIVLGSYRAVPSKNDPEQKNGCSRENRRASERLKRLNPGKEHPHARTEH
jgi:hypothetical protein